MSTSQNLKQLSVKIRRSSHIALLLSDGREAVQMRRCAVRVKRLNIQKLQKRKIKGNLYKMFKLKRLRVRVIRMPSIADEDSSVTEAIF